MSLLVPVVEIPQFFTTRTAATDSVLMDNYLEDVDRRDSTHDGKSILSI